MRLQYDLNGEAIVSEVDEVLVGIEFLSTGDRYDVEIKYNEENDEYQVIVGDEIVWSVIDEEQVVGEGHLADSDPGTQIGSGA